MVFLKYLLTFQITIFNYLFKLPSKSTFGISFDVTFTLDLIKNKTINWPRAENDDYILTAGNARPLDQCVQHATTEMLAWLQSDYGLDARTAHLFLGQCVEYDMGNVYDPAYTMICKIPKDKLAALQA